MTVILLATYNGATYLPQMLHSLGAQTFRDWRLLVRDDGSTDETREIVVAAAAGDSRIELVEDNITRLGAAGNFGRLMESAQQVDARYVLFADQDDVWLSHKIAVQRAELLRVEAEYGSDTPVLVHTDLSVVDADLRMLQPSFREFARLHHDSDYPLAALLFANNVSGCATFMNRAALDVAAPLPTEALMHDWWTALCTAASGQVRYLPQPTLLYRQHRGNALGAHSLWHKWSPFHNNLQARWDRKIDDFSRGLDQIRALHRRLAERHTVRLRNDAHDSLHFLAECCEILDQPTSTWQQWRQLRRLVLHRASWVRQSTVALRLWAVKNRRAA